MSSQKYRSRLRGYLLSAWFIGCSVAVFDMTAAVGLCQDTRPPGAADTSSPRDTLRSFINACNRIYGIVRQEKYLDRENPIHSGLANQIHDCLDSSKLPAFAREQWAGEAAVCLKEILDRVDLPPWEEIPDTEQIEAAGGYEKLTRWRVPGTRITIDRIEEGPQKHEYLFSDGTVGRAVDYYNNMKMHSYRTSGPETSQGIHEWFLGAPRGPLAAAIVARLPVWMQRGRTLGMANWKWLGLFIAAIITICVMAGAYWLHLRFTDPAHERGMVRYWLTLIFPIVAALAPLQLMSFAENDVGTRGTPFYWLSFTCVFVAILAGVVIVFALSTRVAETIIASPRINPQGLNAQLIRINAKLLATTGAAVLVLFGGQYLGIPVATLLASAGIGGLAIALGAQDTLKDLCGTMSLMADKPFVVGDRIVLDRFDGVVEDIGLRSTRLRLLTGHLVTLPNEFLARHNIENVGRRPYIRKIADIHIPLDTPRDKLLQAIQAIREALQGQEGLDPELPPRVYFTDYLPTAFNIRVIYWYRPPNYWDFLAFSERINLAIFAAFEAQDIPFSLPMRVAHTTIDSKEKPLEVALLDHHGS